MIDQLKSVHSAWVKLTGQELKYQPCERMLFDFVNSGFTVQDLECVLTFMLWSNSKREPKYRDRIQFHRIVGDLEVFNSRLGEAHAWHRNRRPSPSDKEKVLAQWRGNVEVKPETTPRIIKAVLKDMSL